jgi:hypothetical protein
LYIIVHIKIFIVLILTLQNIIFFFLLGDINNPCISPASFLRCLRSNKINLTIEEEAILLDCLDIERIAEVESKKFHTNKRKNSLISPMKNNKQLDTLNKNKNGFDKNNSSSYYENESDNDNENSDDYVNYGNKNRNNYENNNNNNSSISFSSSIKNTNIPAKNVLLESENTAPLIFYKSFLNFCTRHCGSWSGK